MVNSWWSRERHSCRQAGKRAISCPSPVDYWIPGKRGCSGWSDRTSLPCHQTEDAKLLSWFCRWRVFHTVSCKRQNRSFSLDRSAVVEGPRIVRSSVELEPLQQLRRLGRE
ncbi:hypothetical protein TNCV_882871 [Trichonephila clavipes]|nr:hypothetical protein TNCV_882871 [Trichonephila clavipes]